MNMYRNHNQFHPITKQMIAKMGMPANVDELCGVASVTMLLRWNGQDIPLSRVLDKMSSSGAYEEGAGTYLRRTAKIFDSMHYLHRTPYLLMYLLNVVGNYAFIASIKRKNDGNHIVFVYKCNRTHVYYYDPNLTEVAQLMSHKEWNKVSNGRAVALKAKG